MSDSIHPQLLGHLLGALDDDEQEALDARLEHDPACCRTLARWRRRLAPLEALRPEYEPTPGLVDRTCRLVAAYAAAPTDVLAPASPRRMTPIRVPHSRTGGVGRLDVAVVAVLMVMAGTLVFPAIREARFQAGVAECQTSLRAFSDTLTNYGSQHGAPPAALASQGRLTDEGVTAALLLAQNASSSDDRPAYPDAWLAAQIAPCDFHDDPNDGPGTWRDGTTNDSRLPPPRTGVPLLADAPSADLPGPSLDSHGGLGRNVLFDDGRIDFVPGAISIANDATVYSAPTTMFPTVAPAKPRVSVPIIFVNGQDHR